VHEEKSGYVAHHGTVEPHAEGEDSDTEEPPTPGIGGVRTRDDKEREDAEAYDSTSSSHTRVNDNGATYNMASGRKIDDPEKGRDLYIVDWNGPDDPEVRRHFTARLMPRTLIRVMQNPLNWSQNKKFFVTFESIHQHTPCYVLRLTPEVCLLTFGIYIGSAIYTAGILDITKVFDVSEVKALLGLTLFVAGYGIGKPCPH